jgi:hypothetical protein
MSQREKSPTQASYVKSLSLAELQAIRDKRAAEQYKSAAPLTTERAQTATSDAESGGVFERLKERARHAGQNVEDFVLEQQSQFRQTAIDLDDSEFCLEPEEIAVLARGGVELPQPRLQHYENCKLCQEVVVAAGSVGANCHDIGDLLARMAAQPTCAGTSGEGLIR